MISYDQISQWTGQTWNQALASARNSQPINARTVLETLLQRLRNRDDYAVFSRAPVTGAISQGWKDLNAQGPLFQSSLVKVATSYPGDWTPAEYLWDYYLTCSSGNIRSESMDLGRALRNLPSFLREYMLAAALRDAGVDVRVPEAEENAAYHVDITLTLGGRDITVWNYLNTDKGCSFVARKIQSRGSIKSGLNLLAPIRMGVETTNYHGWYVPSQDYIRRLIHATSEEAEPFSRISDSVAENSGFGFFRLFKHP
jgi:hypothetical protein